MTTLKRCYDELSSRNRHRAIVRLVVTVGFVGSRDTPSEIHMLRAIVFDLFETLITESQTRPAGVSSLAPRLGCERDPFRREWKGIRPTAVAGRSSFARALGEIATRLHAEVDDEILQRLSEERACIKAVPFDQIESAILGMLAELRHRGLRLGVISNCFAEDVAAWPRSRLASRVDCAVFSHEVGVAKPDPAIYLEATRRLRTDAAETWYVGDGGDSELSGAANAGLRAFRARWFLKRWPHYRDEPCAASNVDHVADVVRLVDETLDC